MEEGGAKIGLHGGMNEYHRHNSIKPSANRINLCVNFRDWGLQGGQEAMTPELWKEFAERKNHIFTTGYVCEWGEDAAHIWDQEDVNEIFRVAQLVARAHFNSSVAAWWSACNIMNRNCIMKKPSPFFIPGWDWTEVP